MSNGKVVKMEYQFVHTVHGPAVKGEDEVLFFHQIPQLVDYADSDPEFFEKARSFIKETILEFANRAVANMYEPTAGFEQSMTIGTYMNAIELLFRLEHETKPAPGFPGNNPPF